ncbi:P1 family peptidase [Candidatus Palauibacter sp.]|uniref:P1 family peptidase n=1 Tax=Candidatus Palauibacter sp. TaxID=3101350 RepID=UPI003B01BD64
MMLRPSSSAPLRGLIPLALAAALVLPAPPAYAQERRSARDLGIDVGVLPTGPLNLITDVAGVRVGHVTVTSGDTINTGVTAILPHGGNVFREKVPAAFVAGNAFGKFAGTTQVQELGELESPVVLTCTLCVPRAADAVMTYLLGLPGNENVRSVNPVVGETNDGFLNRIRLRPITESDVLTAIAEAETGSFEQGSVGAGRGTIAFGWKGGIGSASRRLPEDLGGWTVGVLVQSNHGGVLAIDGAPVGEALGGASYGGAGTDAPYPRAGIRPRAGGGGGGSAEAPDQAQTPNPPGSLEDGSIIMVVATDAPLEHRNLERLARRALLGLGRGGGSMSNGSGDYVLAFSSVPLSRLWDEERVPNAAMSPLFQAAAEATEEAILNSMFLATTVEGDRGTVEAIPLEPTLEVLRRYGVVPH